MAVTRRIGPGDHAVCGQKRIDTADFFWTDNLHVEADNFRHAVDIFEPSQLALVGRQPDAARFVPADILPGNSLQPRIKVIAVGMDFREIIATRDARTLPRRVPCGAGRQLIFLNQQAIGPAKFSEMVEQ